MLIVGSALLSSDSLEADSCSKEGFLVVAGKLWPVSNRRQRTMSLGLRSWMLLGLRMALPSNQVAEHAKLLWH